MQRTRLVAAITAALTLGALAAASAPAATTALGGSPLNVYVGDQGQLQAFRDGLASGISSPRRHMREMPGSSSPTSTCRRSTASTAAPVRAA